jgi:cysteine dioxygenase
MMTGQREFPGLAPLMSYLGELTGQASIRALHERLQESRATLEGMRDYVRFDPVRYARNLVTESPWYSLQVLCWRSGQRSTIHDHAGSFCAFKVLTGVATETVYRFSPCGQVVPTHTRDFQVGEVATPQPTEPHQVSNLQPPGCDLVTLHVYTPPLKNLRTFSIMGDGLMTDWIGAGRAGWLPDETQASLMPYRPCLDDGQFEKVVRFMHANLKHDIHLADFAKQTGHTSAHFSVLFKNRTGCSPFHYLKELRLREAHRMIVAGERNLARVALASGYTNRGHFSEVFLAYWKYSARNLMKRVQQATMDHRR